MVKLFLPEQTKLQLRLAFCQVWGINAFFSVHLTTYGNLPVNTMWNSIGYKVCDCKLIPGITLNVFSSSTRYSRHLYIHSIQFFIYLNSLSKSGRLCVCHFFGSQSWGYIIISDCLPPNHKPCYILPQQFTPYIPPETMSSIPHKEIHGTVSNPSERGFQNHG